MKSVKNSWCNSVYLGPHPDPDIEDLPVRRERTLKGKSVVSSFWKPTPEELAQLNSGGTVRLCIYYVEPIPPVSVDVVTTPEDLN